MEEFLVDIQLLQRPAVTIEVVVICHQGRQMMAVVDHGRFTNIGLKAILSVFDETRNPCYSQDDVHLIQNSRIIKELITESRKYPPPPPPPPLYISFHQRTCIYRFIKVSNFLSALFSTALCNFHAGERKNEMNINAAKTDSDITVLSYIISYRHNR